MKFIKDILNESFQFIPKKILSTGNDKFFGEKADTTYTDAVRECVQKIALEDFSYLSNPHLLEKVEAETLNQMLKEEQQLEAIIHNCNNRNFRPQYTAEVIYHTIVQGRLNALKERPGHAGGLMEAEGIAWSGTDVTKAPVIGTITTKAFNFGGMDYPEDEMEVVEILQNKGGTMYVVNRWNNPSKKIPQLVHADQVKSYKPTGE